MKSYPAGYEGDDMSDEHYLEGARAAQLYYNSQGYASLTRFIRAEEAIKLFLPPVTEALVQYVTPMPKPRKDWMKGFKEEQAAILAEGNKKDPG